MNRVTNQIKNINIPALLVLAMTLTIMLVGFSYNQIFPKKEEKTQESPTIIGVNTIIQRPTLYAGTTESNIVTVGNPKGRIEVHMFLDLSCPICRIAHASLMTAYDKSPLKNEIRLLFRHFPLNNECNPAAPRVTHADACLRAAQLQCAFNQGKDIRPVLHDLYEAPLPSTPALKACIQSPKVLEQIAQESKIGESVNVEFTPHIYMNGKMFMGTYSQPQEFMEAFQAALQERPDWTSTR